MHTANDKTTIDGVRDSGAHAGEKVNGNVQSSTITTTTTTDESSAQDKVNGDTNHDQPDHLEVLDSRTRKVYNIPITDGFVRGSDLGTIKAPISGGDGRLKSLAVLDPGFQNTACKESSITHM